jgi:gliding motility-associated-like protein
MLGINIFTATKSRMKELLILLFIIGFTELTAQVVLQADDTTVCNAMLVKFSIQPSSSHDTITAVSWDFGNGEVSSDLSPSMLYADAGKYTVSCLINGSFNISVTDMIRVIECSDTLKTPNVITPNEDRINDVFEVKTNGVSIYSFSVFTRSGTLIYKTESPTIMWDGTSLKQHMVKSGIYYYTIHPLDGNPLNEIKGFVYLFNDLE